MKFVCETDDRWKKEHETVMFYCLMAWNKNKQEEIGFFEEKK